DGITIDGNRYSGGVSDGIGIYGAVLKLSNYEVRACSGVGQWTEFTYGGTKAKQNNVQSQFCNAYIHDNGKGIEFGGPNDSDFYSVYSYLNDEANLRTYYAGTGKFTNCHFWCGAVGEPQVTTNLDLGTEGNIFIGCAIEGAKREQIWARVGKQTFVGCYVFYNQASVAGVTTVGLRIGDDTPGSQSAAGNIRFSGKIYGVHQIIKFSSDGGYHVLDIDGYVFRAGSVIMSGSQLVVGGSLPTSDIKAAIQFVSDGVNPAPTAQPSVYQVSLKPSFFNGLSVAAGPLSVGVSDPLRNFDHAGGRWHRQANTSGALLSEEFTANRGLRWTLDSIDGLGGGELYLNAYATDQITLTTNGVKQFGLGPYASDAAAGAAGIPQGVSYKRTDGTWAYKL
ncbi:hypothetical protein, partial [Methylobacterium sp.]|uniref:hypothetical protein n=1 Tax=Methylobacterium sp. TaxID=409 RepID=UPI0025FC5BD2